METWQSLGSVPGVLELDFQFFRKATVESVISRFNHNFRRQSLFWKEGQALKLGPRSRECKFK